MGTLASASSSLLAHTKKTQNSPSINRYTPTAKSTRHSTNFTTLYYSLLQGVSISQLSICCYRIQGVQNCSVSETCVCLRHACCHHARLHVQLTGPSSAEAATRCRLPCASQRGRAWRNTSSTLGRALPSLPQRLWSGSGQDASEPRSQHAGNRLSRKNTDCICSQPGYASRSCFIS